MEIKDLEQEAETFLHEIGLEYYLHGAGLKNRLEISPIYERHSAVYNPDVFAEIRAEPVESKYQRFLLEHVAQVYLESLCKTHNERIAGAETETLIPWDESQLTYRSASVYVANEPNVARRHQLDQLHREATAGIAPLYQERHDLLMETAKELVQDGYVHIFDELRGLHLSELRKTMEAFLRDTRNLHFGALEDYLRGLGQAVEDAWKCDLSWLFRLPQYDSFFPQKAMLQVLRQTLAELRIYLEEQSNIRIDSEFRPQKSPRAFCSPINIPEDVRLVIMPTGGKVDYSALFHEMGHAQHFANTDSTLPFPFKWLGDNSITEGYAFLLESLITDDNWLARHLEFEDSGEFRRACAFQKLYMLRRYATKLLYEGRLHLECDYEALSDWYAEIFTYHLGVQYGPESFLADVDDGFYCAQYLRAWIFDVHLRAYLAKEYDEEWYRLPKAGKFLVELWREGQKYTAEELVRFLGYDGLDMGLLQDEIYQSLR